MDLSYNCPANAEPYLCQQLLQRMIKTLQQVTYTLYKNKQIQPKTQKSLQIFSWISKLSNSLNIIFIR